MIKILDGKEVEMTELEIQQLEQSRITAWSKEAHLAEINALHEAEFDSRLRAAGYVGRWELVAAASDAANEYNQEAKTILTYWWDGWNAIETYAATVTEDTAQSPEDTAQSPEDFVKTL